MEMPWITSALGESVPEVGPLSFEMPQMPEMPEMPEMLDQSMQGECLLKSLMTSEARPLAHLAPLAVKLPRPLAFPFLTKSSKAR